MPRRSRHAVLGLTLFVIACTHDAVAPEPALRPVFARGSAPPADPAIAFEVSGTVDKLVVMNADGSNQTTLLEGDKFAICGACAPSWSPTGGSIAFGGTIGGQGGIWLIAVVVSGGTVTGRNLRLRAANAGGQAWSPTSDTIAFVQNFSVDSSRSVWGMPATGGTPTRLYTAAAGHMVTMPDWSPDGSKLVFVEMDAGLTRSLLIFDRGAARVDTVLPASDFFVRFPEWSRRGDRVAFSGYRGSDPEAVYTVAVAPSATPVRVVQGAAPTWSPDDTKILFAGNQGLTTYEFATRKTQRIARAGWRPDWRRF